MATEIQAYDINGNPVAMPNREIRDTIRQALKDWNAATPEDRKRAIRNANARARNRALRELCGTSARQARLDMGL